MPYQLRISNDAAMDLTKLHDYLQFQFDSLTSDKILTQLFSKFNQLKVFLFIGEAALIIRDIYPNFQFLRGKHNTILYEVLQEQSIVIIQRVFDNHQDIETIVLNKYNRF